jgi:exopolysaccharide biosynthesis polyprenyl glycosylphosphotransferase
MDLVLMLAALGASIVILYSPDAEVGVTEYTQDFLVTRIKLSNAILCAALLVFWHFCFKACGLYESYRLRNTEDAVPNILKAVAWASMALVVAAQFGGWETITLVTVLLFAICATTFIAGLRMAVYHTSRVFRRRGMNTKSLLVIGGGNRAQKLMKRISGRAELGYKIIGFLDSAPSFSRAGSSGVPYLGEFTELDQIIDSQVVDEVAIALPIKSQYAQIKTAIDRLEEQGIAVHLLSDFFPQQLAKTRPTEFQGLPLLSLTSTAPICWKTEVKRLVDFCVSAMLLLIGAPVFIVAAIAIKLDSRGPVFFCQERMGYNKRRFTMIKFRTMVTDAETRIDEIAHLNEKDGPIFKISNDPRVTRVGKFLRKFSIDELPQLFNVLIGDMSLVGPRPLSIRDALAMDQSWQKRRFSVKPGMTCLWQISGRSNLSFDQWVELDLEYIDTWSLKLDWWILLKTVPAVVAARGAV